MKQVMSHTIKKFFHYIPYTVVKNFILCASGATALRVAQNIIALFILPPAAYGITTVAASFITISSMIFGLGVRQALSLQYFHHRSEPQLAVIRATIACYSIGTVIYGPLYFTCLTTINHLFFASLLSFTDLSLLFLTTWVLFFTDLHTQLLQYEERSAQLAVTQLICACCTILITALCIYYTPTPTQTTILIANSLSACLSAIIAITARIDLYCSIFSTPIAQCSSLFAAGIPFLPGMLASWIIGSASRSILLQFNTAEEVGVYAVAGIASQLFHFFILHPWGGSYLPHQMKLLSHAKTATDIFHIEQKNRYIMLYSILVLVACITISWYPVKTAAQLLLPPFYHAAFSYIPLLLISDLCLLGSYFSALLLQYYKATYTLAGALCIPALTTITITRLTVPYWGAYGCAIATGFSQLLYLLILRWRANNLLSHIQLMCTPAVTIQPACRISTNITHKKQMNEKQSSI